ncbi:hypothetical protein TU87_05250 [Pseudomonas weihenstephanensis]|nr:hypothetical protein TU87_05250 [Pseudomonas weihenstephanensis]
MWLVLALEAGLIVVPTAVLHQMLETQGLAKTRGVRSLGDGHSGDRCRQVSCAFAQSNALASRDSDAKDVDCARTAVEVVALRHVVGVLCRGTTRLSRDLLS